MSLVAAIGGFAPVADGAERQYVNSWIGNTFGTPEKAVPYTIKSILLTDDEHVYINTRSSEQIYVHQIYDGRGNWVGKYDTLNKKGGNAIASDGTHLYYNHDFKTDWIQKSRLKDHQKINRVNVSFGEIVGMACGNGVLYASDKTNTVIRRLRTTDLSLLDSIDVSAQIREAGRIAVDGDGSVWIIDVANTDIHCYDASGTHWNTKKISSVDKPACLAVDRSRRLLYIANNGEDYNIKVFDISGDVPALDSTVGVTGGAFQGTSTKGRLGPLRFNGIYAISVNSAGNLAISCGGASIWKGAEVRWLRKSNGKWSEAALVRADHFCDSADIDDGDENIIYDMDFKYRMDYSKPPGQQWKNVAVTVCPFLFPHDPRKFDGNKTPGVTVRRVRGRTLVYMSSEDDRFLMVYRLDPERFGEILIPCGVFTHNHIKKMEPHWGSAQPEGNYRWMWTDTSGDGCIDSDETKVLNDLATGGTGWFVDKNGTVWDNATWKVDGVKRGHILQFPLTDVNQHGVPLYSAHPKVTPVADPMRGITYQVYDPDRDVMVLWGETEEKRYTSGFKLSRAAICYDNWSSSPKVRWIHDGFDTSTRGAIHHCWAEGDFMFAGRRDGHIQVHRMSNGRYLFSIHAGPETGYRDGSLDHGPALLRVQKRDNGQYLIIEEESGHCKLMLYQWLGMPPRYAR